MDFGLPRFHIRTQRKEPPPMTALLACLPLAALVALVFVPSQYLPSYRRGGWGRYHRAS